MFFEGLKNGDFFLGEASCIIDAPNVMLQFIHFFFASFIVLMLITVV